MDYVGPTIETVKLIGHPAWKYLQYHRKLSQYVNALRRTKEDLNSRKEDVELSLAAELRVDKMAKKEVESWLKDAEEAINGAQMIEDKALQARYLYRCLLGKAVDEKIQELQKLHEKGKFLGSLVVEASSKGGVSFLTSELVGESTVKEKIWACLMGDEVQKIAASGIGGVGKTTIMMHIHNELLKESKFDKVIWVTVSQDFDVIRLQKDIACVLGEEKTMSKYSERAVRAAMLSKILEKQGRYVLILDDVWQKFSINDIGVLEADLRKGCKLVLTTRSIEVGRLMDCEIIKVEPLAEGDALSLFLSKVGHGILRVPTLGSTLKLIVEQCGGLPLAIVTIAGSLKGIYDPQRWVNALNEIRGLIRSVESAGNPVFECLKFSYYCLKDSKLQHCFLCCALYPEDFEIRKEELIQYWIDEGLIEEMETRQAMNYRGHAILLRLEENCLLESVRDGKFVKMHDLVRDMALHITSVTPRFMIKAGLQLEELPNDEEWTTDLEKASLIRNSISRFPANMSPKCRMLSALLLRENPLTRIPESFFLHLDGLKHLDLSRTDIESVPNSMFDLKNLTVLSLNRCVRLTYLPSISRLQQLKKLNLFLSSLKEVPQGLETLVNLRYLDLRMYTLRVMPVGMLPKLSRLQHLMLYRGDLNQLYVKVEEVVGLRKLETFGGAFGDLHGFNTFVKSMQSGRQLINQYFLHLGKMPVWDDYDRCVCITDQNISTNLLLLPIDVQELTIVRCSDIGSLDHIWSFDKCTDLRQCTIANCEKLEALLFLSLSSISCDAPLHRLEELKLRNLKKLIALFTVRDNSTPAKFVYSGTFSCLRDFLLDSCSSIKQLFFPGLLPNLRNLERLLLFDAEQLVEVIATPAPIHHDEEGGNHVKFFLPRLRDLELRNLPQLKSICPNRGVIGCNSLQELRIFGCPKLQRIPLFLTMLENGQPSPPPSLRFICATRDWWESLKWDNPDFKNVLEPFCTM